VFDNTNGLSPDLIPSRRRALAATFVSANALTAYGVVFRFSEADSVCGPGQYIFTKLDLLLSQSTTAGFVAMSLSVQLWQNGAGGLPATLRAQTPAVISVGPSPGYVAVQIPRAARFIVDSSADGSVSYTITFLVSESSEAGGAERG